MERKGLSGSSLKLIAIFSMLIDHIGAVLLPGSPYYGICREIGRLAFPIFCFLLVEGYVHTHDVKQYGRRLLVFALLSELPFDLAFSGTAVNFGYQNVYFTLFLGLAALYIMDRTVNPELRLVVAVVFMVFAEILKTDYSWKGVAAIILLYMTRENRLWQMITGGVFFAWELPAPAAFVPVYFYNGKRGIPMKYLFYLFYPAHLLVLVLLRQLLT